MCTFGLVLILSHMFKVQTIRAFAIIAILVSVLGLLLSGVMMTQASAMFFLGVLSWALLLWASIIGLRLTRYPLHEDDLKKVGIRVYLILAAFMLFMVVGVVLGLLFSAALLASVWGMKKNYDEWDSRSAE
ncbi:MAG: hypothetical protein JWR44_3813 [Hymenobacter sp.]|jgi:hypothetical protein|nr:hypothetical protein [Hymenobacter sp.]